MMKVRFRESNIELMRIVLMTMIILHHIIAYNFDLYDSAVSFDRITQAILLFLDTSCIMAVNCFFLVSGYYRIKFNIKKMARLVIDAYFYYTVITLIGVCMGKVKLSGSILFNIIDPIDNYWFISVYLMLILFSRAINEYLDKMTRKQYLYFVTCAFLLLGIYGFILNKPQLGLNTGYSIMGASCLYVIGGGMKKWEKLIHSRKSLLFWFVITLGNYGLILISVLYTKKMNIALRLLSYSNPLVALQAMSFFKFFTSLKIGTIKSVNKVSEHSLSAYYVNSSNWLAMSFKNVVISVVTMKAAIISAIPFALLSVAFAVSIDIIKCALFDKFENKMCEKLQ